MESNLAARAVPALRCVGGGIDTLHLFWRVPLSLGDVERLRQLQTEARELGRKVKLPSVRYGDQLLEVKPNAARAGPLLLQNDAMSVVVNPDPLAGMPSLMVDINAWWLWQRGADAAVSDAQAVVFDLAGDQADDDQLSPRVTRIDLCVDVQGWLPTAEQLTPRRHKAMFPVAFNDQLHTRAVKFELHCEKRFESARFGTKASGISAELYNKTLELEVSGKDWFEEVWARSGNYEAFTAVDGEQVRQDVVRLEFRVKREGLTEFREHDKLDNFDTWEDVRKHLSGLWRYLTRYWLVMRGKRSKADRLAHAVTPFWQQLVDAGEKLLQPETTTVLRSRIGKIAEKHVAALAGYAVSLHAARQWYARNQRYKFKESIPWILEELFGYVDRAGWDPDIRATERLMRWTRFEHAQLLGEDVREAA